MHYQLSVLFISLSLSFPGSAEDSLSSVLARMNPKKAVRIRYQETRHMEMLAEPWQGSGYLYALSPSLMIKEQWRPKRELMGIKNSEMYYADLATGQTRRGKLGSSQALSLNVAAFKALMTGDKTFLTQQYRVEFCSKPELWQLSLLPKQSTNGSDISKITMEGLPDRAAQKISIVQGDGDRTHITLKPAGQGSEINQTIQQIFTELEAK